MSTQADVRRFIGSLYRRPQISDADAFASVVSPSSVKREAPILGGFLRKRFNSKIANWFIEKKGQTIGDICNETIRQTRQPTKATVASSADDFIAGWMSAQGERSLSDISDSKREELAGSLATHLGVSNLPAAKASESAAAYIRRMVEETE